MDGSDYKPDAIVEFSFGFGEDTHRYKTDQKLATLIETAVAMGFKPKAVVALFEQHLKSGRIEPVGKIIGRLN